MSIFFSFGALFIPFVILQIFTISISTVHCKMIKKTVSNYLQRRSLCNDNSPPIYYITERINASTTGWIIFLESGGACRNGKECQSRSQDTPFLMSSNQYPDDVIGKTVLSSSKKENPLFYSYNKVLVPYCSSDLWLGDTSSANLNVLSNKSHTGLVSKNFTFAGLVIFRTVIEDISTLGFAKAHSVVLAGSSAGGIGVLNHINWLSTKVPRAKIAGLVDSAWFINFENELSLNIGSDFMRQINSQGVQACLDYSQGHPCCVSALCMLSRNYVSEKIGLMFITSLYDIYMLFNKEIVGEFSKPLNILRRLNSFQGQKRSSISIIKNRPKLSFFVSSCFQHVYLATSSLWLSGGILFNEFKASHRIVTFKHFTAPEIWRKTKINGKSLSDSIYAWNFSHNKVQLIDNCQGAQCNPTCVSGVFYEVPDQNRNTLTRITSIAITVSLCIGCIIVKIWLHVRYVRLQRSQKDFLKKFKTIRCPALGIQETWEGTKIGVSCQNLTYEITQRKSFRNLESIQTKPWSKVQHPRSSRQKQILKDISIYLNPGQLVAIMGPSGSGKTTLLDILTGRRKNRTLKGEIYVNGQPVQEVDKWFVSQSGYVLQLATPYYSALTVRENLTYSALIRLPQNVSLAEKFARVEEIIDQTGLSNVADVPVGGLTGPGLSGGQKRRLCVASQLLDSPKLLFLDEPTSGLDSSASLELLNALHHVAIAGRLVLLTIHQPRLEIFHMFHAVLLLCKGKVAFYGSPLKAPKLLLTAVREAGLEISFDPANPADSIMDALNSEEYQEVILSYYQKTGEIQSINNAIDVAKKHPIISMEPTEGIRGASFLDRIFALECRAISSWKLSDIIYLPLVFALYGLALSSVYWKTESLVLLMSCYMVFSCASQLFMSSVVYSHLQHSLPLFELERADGIGTSLELVMESFIRLSAVSFLPVILCSIILYFCVVQEYSLLQLLEITLINVLLNKTWIAINIFVGSVSIDNAALIGPMLSAVAGFSGGFLVPKPDMPTLYHWLFYVNPTHWGYASTMKLLLNNTETKCRYESPLECQSTRGIFILDNFGFSETDPWFGIVILLVMTLIALLSSIACFHWKTGIFSVSFAAVALRLKKRFLEIVTSCRRGTGWMGRKINSLQDGSTLGIEIQLNDSTMDGRMVPNMEKNVSEYTIAKFLDEGAETHSVYCRLSNRDKLRRLSSTPLTAKTLNVPLEEDASKDIKDISSNFLRSRKKSMDFRMYTLAKSFPAFAEETIKMKRMSKHWARKTMTNNEHLMQKMPARESTDDTTQKQNSLSINVNRKLHPSSPSSLQLPFT